MSDLKPIQTLKPFTKFCCSIGAIPTSYLVSMSYEEQLIWLCDYLENTIIPTIDNNAGAVTELQNLYVELKSYVDNYFTNLDVQNEINNKLDSMAQDGTFDNILMNYTNITRIYNTTVDLINDKENLVNNQKIKTLGYYSINDGGNGYFIITNIKDNLKFQIDLENGLYAQLIPIDNEINANALGCDSTGLNDSSIILNNILSIINERWIQNLNDINTVILNGKYLINNTILFPPCARFRGIGYVELNTNTINSAIKINYLDDRRPTNFPVNHQNWLYAELINFSEGGGLINKLERGSTVGIEIGEYENKGLEYTIARYKICNMTIYNYNIAILHNNYNVYIGKYERLNLETNNICVQFGSIEGNSNNAGEHMSFSECLFASSNIAFNWLCNSYYVFINHSSFDFNKKLFVDKNKGYRMIEVDSSHIEGNDIFFENIGIYTHIVLINNRILHKPTSKMENESTNNTTVTIILKNNRISSQSSSENPIDPLNNLYILNYRYLFLDNVSQGGLYKVSPNLNLIAGNVFDEINDGDIPITKNSKIGNLKVVLKGSPLKDNGIIVTDNYLYEGHKSLVLIRNENSDVNASFNIESDLLPVKNFKHYSNAYTYNSLSGVLIKYEYYDSNKNKIGETTSLHNNNNVPTDINNWYCSFYSKEEIIPNNACYFKVIFYFTNLNDGQYQPEGTQYKIGGLIVN